MSSIEYQQQKQRMINVIYVHTVDREKTFDDFHPVCSHFACARRLSLPESLAGSLCTHHMNIKPINITSTIKKP